MEKGLPQNIDAECGVLGSLLIDPDAVALVATDPATSPIFRWPRVFAWRSGERSIVLRDRGHSWHFPQGKYESKSESRA